MKYAFAAIALAAVARAQSRDDLPKCALPALDKSIKDNSDCDVTDIACVCKNFGAIRTDASASIIDDCGVDVALNEVLPAAQKLCENPPPASSKAESSAPAETTVSETTIVSTSAVTLVPSTVIVTPTPSASVTLVPINSTSSSTGSGSGTTPGAPAETSAPAEGAAAMVGSMGALAMLALGALAL